MTQLRLRIRLVLQTFSLSAIVEIVHRILSCDIHVTASKRSGPPKILIWQCLYWILNMQYTDIDIAKMMSSKALYIDLSAKMVCSTILITYLHVYIDLLTNLCNLLFKKLLHRFVDKSV